MSVYRAYFCCGKRDFSEAKIMCSLCDHKIPRFGWSCYKFACLRSKIPCHHSARHHKVSQLILWKLEKTKRGKRHLFSGFCFFNLETILDPDALVVHLRTSDIQSLVINEEWTCTLISHWYSLSWNTNLFFAICVLQTVGTIKIIDGRCTKAAWTVARCRTVSPVTTIRFSLCALSLYALLHQKSHENKGWRARLPPAVFGLTVKCKSHTHTQREREKERKRERDRCLDENQFASEHSRIKPGNCLSCLSCSQIQLLWRWHAGNRPLVEFILTGSIKEIDSAFLFPCLVWLVWTRPGSYHGLWSRRMQKIYKLTSSLTLTRHKETGQTQSQVLLLW